MAPAETPSLTPGGGGDAGALLAGLAERSRTSPLQVGWQVVSSVEAGEGRSSGHAYEVGDLNGDGRDDVLLVDVATGTEVGYGVRALSGGDGSLLWSRQPGQAGFSYLLPLEDLTGDGLPDLVALDLLDYAVEKRDCSEPTADCSETLTQVAWSVSVVSGETGADVWAHAGEGTELVRESFTPPVDVGAVETYEHRFVLSNGFDLPALVSSRVGWSVLLVGTDVDRTRVIDRQGITGVIRRSESTRTVEETVSLRLYDAASGDLVHQRTVGPADTLTFVSPTDDLDGDGHAELFFSRYTGLDHAQTCYLLVVETLCEGSAPRDQADLALWDGASLDAWWTRDYQDELVFRTIGLGADVDGDGIGDVVTWFGDLETPPRAAVMTGVTGAILFLDHSAFAFAGVHDVDGDGLDDLLKLSGYPNGVRLVRVRGIDGTQLFETRHGAEFSGNPAFYESWYVLPAHDDYDADGLPDHVIGWQRYREDERVVRPHSSTVAVESMTGAILWHAEVTGVAFADDAGDADNDGLADFVLTTKFDTGQGSAPHVHVLSGATGQELWQMAFDTTFLAAAAIGTMDDLQGDDVVVYHDVGEGSQRHTVFEALNGATAATLWTARSWP